MKTPMENWKEILNEVTKNASYVATRRKASVEDDSRYARLLPVDGDECLLRRFYADALSEVSRVLSIPYHADARRQALIEYESRRYVIAYITAEWLQTVAPDESDYYALLSARLLDHLSELAYRQRSNRPTRRRMFPWSPHPVPPRGDRSPLPVPPRGEGVDSL